jgi:hypothetical protein
LIQKKDIRNNSKLITKEEAYNCQIKEKDEKKIFNKFWETDKGKRYKKVKSQIEKEHEIKDKQRAVIDKAKLLNTLSNTKEHNIIIGLKELAFIYKIKTEEKEINILTSTESEDIKIDEYKLI